jgi:hypothetical protein
MDKITPRTHPTLLQVVNQYENDEFFTAGSLAKAAAGTETKPEMILAEMDKGLRSEIGSREGDKEMLILPVPGWSFDDCGKHCLKSNTSAIELRNRKYASKGKLLHASIANCSNQSESKISEILAETKGLYL